MSAVRLLEHLPAVITRPRQLIEAVLAQSLLEMGAEGRTALAWDWALTGTRPSPVTLSLPPGCPPSREELLAESAAPAEGSTALAGVPSDFCDELGEARRVLVWLVGATDEIPVDDENRGRFIDARDSYARTDADIRQVRDNACRGLAACDRPDPMDPADARTPWQWDAGQMNAAWLRGARDLLDWVLGERATSPLCGRTVRLPVVYDLTFEDTAASDVVLQGRPGGLPVDPAAFPPPQYGEAVQAAIRWLRGETPPRPPTSTAAAPTEPAQPRLRHPGSGYDTSQKKSSPKPLPHPTAPRESAAWYGSACRWRLHAPTRRPRRCSCYRTDSRPARTFVAASR